MTITSMSCVPPCGAKGLSGNKCYAACWVSPSPGLAVNSNQLSPRSPRRLRGGGEGFLRSNREQLFRGDA
jgi:hypothetical protein